MALPPPDRMSGCAAPAYVRHKPEQTLLYQRVEQYWPEFQLRLIETGCSLPGYVSHEFEDYLACGRLDKGVYASTSRAAAMSVWPWRTPWIQLETSRLLHELWYQTHGGDGRASGGSSPAAQACPPVGAEFPVFAAFCVGQSPTYDGQGIGYGEPDDLCAPALPDLINKAGFKVTQGHTGGVTLIQRFGSALNLNLHFHVLFIDGVYSPKSDGELRFHRVNAPTSNELDALVTTISERVARYLERQGWLARDEQSDYLTLPFEADDDDTLQLLQGHSITCRIAMATRADRSGHGQIRLEDSVSGWDYWAEIRHVLFERGGLGAPTFRTTICNVIA